MVHNPVARQGSANEAGDDARTSNAARIGLCLGIIYFEMDKLLCESLIDYYQLKPMVAGIE